MPVPVLMPEPGGPMAAPAPAPARGRSARARLHALALLAAAPFCVAAPLPANAQQKNWSKGVPEIALLLPARSSRFGAAGEALRRGFLAAQKLDGVRSFEVVETDESPKALVAALTRLRDRGVRVAVGPLTRAGAGAVLSSGRGILPVVLLNDADIALDAPPSMIAFGLSSEQEARRIVDAAIPAPPVGAPLPPPHPVLLISGTGLLDRRMSEGFRQALADRGQQPAMVDVPADSAGLQALAAQVRSAPPQQIFLALGMRDALRVRPFLPRGVAIYATSQINPGDAVTKALASDLAGIHFVEMPWLTEPDHPAVMVYPRLSFEDDTVVTVELERLYALGIDAWRVARSWLEGQTRFEVDGVTGMLRVDRDKSPRVERFPAFAVFQGGRVVRDDPAK